MSWSDEVYAAVNCISASRLKTIKALPVEQKVTLEPAELIASLYLTRGNYDNKRINKRTKRRTKKSR